MIFFFFFHNIQKKRYPLKIKIHILKRNQTIRDFEECIKKNITHLKNFHTSGVHPWMSWLFAEKKNRKERANQDIVTEIKRDINNLFRK